ncbi:hypothetical protein CF394_05990 [Tetzosporium hominis]|uniref:HTH cro/C1-type domain-containing protein n=1 Tax=Tetzosporium hominis TaxID=2020506 RepID=A0A264W3X2_9BACL|nr:helix-turn-helix transcriptional regulator [Tetzosporium hominis]OZS78308.1 hypothetical protein CF394_05990 [Tetzosporium hominis]
MKIGSLIKFHRTKQGLTQQTLADGICSVPHLSKIENNSKEANEETIRLLLERLSIDLQDVEKLEEEIKELIIQFADQMYYLEKDEANYSYSILKGKEELIPFTEYLYLYELYKTRYYLMINNIEKVENQLKWLNAHKTNFSQLEVYLHKYISALVLMLRGKMEEADTEIADLLDNALLSSENLGEISYNYSILKSNLNQYSPAIYYGKNALHQFKEDFNFYRIFNVQMLLAVNYSRAKMFNEAIEIYKHLLRNTRILKIKENLPQIYHNLGDLYHTMGSYNDAKQYFNKAMEIVDSKSEFYMLCLYNRAISEKWSGDEETSEQSFEELYNAANESKIVHYQLFSKFYSLQLKDEKAAMDYLESKILPYTKRHSEMKESHKHFTKVLADYYKENGQYDKALELLN